jgi:hypothetical protein
MGVTHSLCSAQSEKLPAIERNKETSLTSAANDARNFSEFIDVPQKNCMLCVLKKTLLLEFKLASLTKTIPTLRSIVLSSESQELLT